MTSEEGLLLIIDALESHAVQYMVVGSFSSNFYGIPRSTKDADIVVQLGAASISDIAQDVKPIFRLDPQASFESVTGTMRYILRHAHTPFYVELFMLGADPHDAARFQRRKQHTLCGRAVYLARVEDVIITKLRWLFDLRRPPDRDDIRHVLSVQQDKIDWDYVHGWCEQHGTRQLLDEILATVPKV